MIGVNRIRSRWARPAAAALLTACLVVASESVADAKARDAIRTEGDDVDFDLHIDAVAKNKGARGSFEMTIGIGDLVGEVTCLDVQGGLGVVAGQLVEGTTAVDVSQTDFAFTLYIADGSITETGADLLNLQLFQGVASGCGVLFPVAPVPVLNGDIVLVDAQ